MSVSMSVSCPSSSFDACKLKEQTRSVFICACPEIAGWKRPKEGATDRAPAKSPLVSKWGTPKMDGQVMVTFFAINSTTINR